VCEVQANECLDLQKETIVVCRIYWHVGSRFSSS